MQLNYYSILGLKRTATLPEIKSAYKKLAIQYHPDKHQGNTYFEEQFKQVSEAYQILSNPQKRRLYDLKLEYVVQQQRVQQQQRAYHTQQRRPASVNERYYRTISKKRRFSRRDWQITIGFFVALILFSLAVKFTMDFITAKTRYRKAEAFMEQAQWSGAHSLLTEAIEFEPEFAEAYAKRGFINQNVYRDYEAAIYDYSAALRFGDAPQAETYFMRGQCHSSLHRFRQAEADFTTAIGLDKNYQAAYFSRGELRLLELNAWQKAVTDLTVFLNRPAEKDAKNKALLYRGFAFYLLDDYNAAIQDYDAALKTDAANGRLYYLLGKAKFSQHDEVSACSSFMQAYKLGYEPAILDWETLCRGK
ncbi:DnaJ domain-containing protein [Adhaeribacter terreus]|uniref:DnaJ domain-containing protein n=1 Tax=Adhaeribacter terreus TaxID=529703 RepID=A0ABW0ECC6_9BACT